MNAPWMLLDDPGNRENKNAGNGGDLVKHTVYLALLDYVLQHEPWATGVRLHECHAGRGIYLIPPHDARRPLVECLYALSTLRAASRFMTHSAQRRASCTCGRAPRTPRNRSGGTRAQRFSMRGDSGVQAEGDTSSK